MRGKVTSSAIMIALMLRAIIVFLAGIYLVTRTKQFRDLVGIEVLQLKVLPRLNADC